ncbi:LysR substrate-binding domain-containing protein [Nitratireductor aquibiodomus]|uniref:LysR substrate-binding domain-containing protein n=1 Tax=Nitratireductor aquibiodomus TaxID=204799 RepID=UPI000469A681|nr:LysR substrate-binding domain-containing protein [Nitratireductor aquibiodomus]
MNVRQLEAFRAVMQSGTITAAAELLHVSQPAVSKLIANLEASCGYDLFVRRAGRTLPTPEAQQLFGKVDQMFLGVDQIRRASNDIRDQRGGQLTIAAFPALASRNLPRILTGFLAERPHLNVSLRSMSSRRIVESVAAQQIDMGFSILPADHSGIEVQHLHRLQRVCVMPANHRLAGADAIYPHDLRGENFISLSIEDPDRLAIEKVFNDLGIQRKIQIEAQHSDSACAFVANGMGVTIIDPFTPADYSSERIVAKPFLPAAYVNVWLLWPAHKIKPQTGLLFANTVRSWLTTSFPRIASGVTL